MLFPRQPALPTGQTFTEPPALEVAPAAAAFTGPPTGQYPVGGFIWDLTGGGILVEEFALWLPCLGQTELTADYPLLSERLGNLYDPYFGVPPAGSFRLPNMRGRMPLADDGGITYLTGAFGGEASHALTVAELASHSHGASSDTQGAHSHGGATAGGQVAVNRVNGTGTDGGYFPRGATGSPSPDANGIYSHSHAIGVDGAHSHNISVSAQGSGTAHNNLPPYVVMTALVRALP